jgi:hypothetical protein
MRKLSFVLLAVGLVGCASNNDSLQRATASSIGNNTAPEQVQIVSVDRGMMETTWQARAGGRNYSCSADDMIRRPYCVVKR